MRLPDIATRLRRHDFLKQLTSLLEVAMPRCALRGNATSKVSASLLRSAGCLAIVPFLLLSLMANGTMTVADADGLPKIVICTGSGPLEVFVDKDGAPLTDQDRSSQDLPSDDDGSFCEWASHAGVATHVLAPDLPAIVLPPSRVDRVVFQDQVPPKPALLRRFARAPPAGTA